MKIHLSIIIKCYQDKKIFDCLDSIDDDCEVVVPYAGKTSLAIEIVDRYPQTKLIKAPKGNLSISCNLGINASTGNSVLIMDSDARFKPGSLSLIKNTLYENLVVKPHIIYKHDASVVGSRVVAETRQRFNDRQIRALTPGLAFRKEISAFIGGYFFDERIRFTEDAVLDWRLKRAGVDLKFVPEAVIYHSPISIYHDLRAGYRMGNGHCMGVHYAGRENDNLIRDLVKRFFTGESLNSFFQERLKNGHAASLHSLAWTLLYHIGFFTERYRIAVKQVYQRD
ncbi:MAG: glycosyltransferase [Methanosarcinaceae archaeon]